MSKPPGGGCDDPRDIHPHRCANCGYHTYFTREACERFYIIPPCPVCDETNWLDETTGCGGSMEPKRPT